MENRAPFGGILPINKPAGWTSHDVVARVRRLFDTKQVGHTGTLDPMATGVLLLLVGRAVKAAEYVVSEKKTYRATMKLGLTTDTEDITGKVLSTTENLPDGESVLSVARSFCVTTLQSPPMYSALKVGGKKLVDLARAGKSVERTPREITIFSLDMRPLNVDTYEMDVTVSAGTYIRTLCADIGAKLGCGGVMASLCREAAGGFSLSDTHTLEEIEALSPEAREALLLPTEQLFFDCPRLSLSPFFARLAQNGCEIYLAKVGTALPAGTRVRLSDEKGRFFALAEGWEFSKGLAAKPVKFFEI